MFAKRPRQPLASTLALMLCLSACIEWKTQNVTPETVVEHKHPKQIRVITTHYDTLTLVSPVVSGDSLIGQVQTSFPAPAGNPVGMGSAQAEIEPAPETMRRVSLPLGDIREIATESMDPTPIIGGALLGAGLVVLAKSLPKPCFAFCK